MLSLFIIFHFNQNPKTNKEKIRKSPDNWAKKHGAWVLAQQKEGLTCIGLLFFFVKGWMKCWSLFY